MNDEQLRALAAQTGIHLEWTDNSGAHRIVGVETLRAILAALGIDCANAHDIANARARLEAEKSFGCIPALMTAQVGEFIELPFRVADGARALIAYEEGGVADVVVNNARLPPIARTGYHHLCIADREIILAVAPRRCCNLDDVAPRERLWGLTAQVYGLRRIGDGGIGDFGAVAQLAAKAAHYRADALSLSPTHALFSADDNHFTPYSPSSRLFHNIVLADPRATFDSTTIAQAAARENIAGAETAELIDWPAAARAKKLILRALFDAFSLRNSDSLTLDFERFRARGGAALQSHAIFEALHAQQFQRDFTAWHWRAWAPQLRDCNSPVVRDFAAANAREVTHHIFLQWLADRSLARAQGAALGAGMRIGLIADLAIGMNNGGSHAWSAPQDLLLGLSIGAPPDPLAPKGQNWGLATFSPRALAARGYAPFLATLRAALKHAGGLRIDHVMGLARLWLTPDGMDASQGAYLTFPQRDLLRLIALESQRHRAIIIGEDLGTVPHGLREELADKSIAGMRVLQFERHHDGFNPPHWYPPGAVAMTSTHDTATTAGWWSGVDLTTRAALDQLPPGQTYEAAASERAHARGALWNAFRAAGVAEGEQPPAEAPEQVVDAAIAFMAQTPAKLVLLPLEDAMGAVEQPNLPGTMDEHPNWRRRYPGEVGACLDAPQVAGRLRGVAERG